MSDELAESIVKAAQKMDAQDKAKLIATIRYKNEAFKKTYFVIHGDRDSDQEHFDFFVSAYNSLILKGYLPASKDVNAFVLKALENDMHPKPVCVMVKPVEKK